MRSIECREDMKNEKTGSGFCERVWLLRASVWIVCEMLPVPRGGQEEDLFNCLFSDSIDVAILELVRQNAYVGYHATI